ncbi:MAG: hypothetical protein J6D28_01205 [Bacilli bacterium]|nr:hypothetical protein [Bacilli bacterium]
MNKGQSSEETRSINILFRESDDKIKLNTQLDDKLTIRILEACLKELKAKTSLK